MKKNRANPCRRITGDVFPNPTGPQAGFPPHADPSPPNAAFPDAVWDVFDLDEVQGEDEPGDGDFWIEPGERDF
jgi:hypothetical protein